MGQLGRAQAAGPRRCGLTLRSSGLPPAGHLGRGAASVIILSAAQAPRRHQPLSSNVRAQSCRNAPSVSCFWPLASPHLLAACLVWPASNQSSCFLSAAHCLFSGSRHFFGLCVANPLHGPACLSFVWLWLPLHFTSIRQFGHRAVNQPPPLSSSGLHFGA